MYSQNTFIPALETNILISFLTQDYLQNFIYNFLLHKLAKHTQIFVQKFGKPKTS